MVLGQRATQREWAVTFAPSQVITTEEWKKRKVLYVGPFDVLELKLA